MNKFIRYYHQNRREIFLIIIIILFAIILLQFINSSITKKNNENKIQETMLNTTDNSENNTYQIITGQNIDLDNEIECISKFIQYCNEGNIEKAYQMVSDECKAVLFPSIEYFKQGYYNNNFNTNKSYDIQSWANSIYKVDLKENMLHTGKTNINNIQDYITVSKLEEEYKLNINNFIGTTTLNKTNNMRNLNIEIISKNTFMNYETYKIKIKNDNDFIVYLDKLNETNNIYITDENDINYVAYSNELTMEQLKINPYSSIEIEIKFTNGYIVDRSLEKITFKEIFLENEEKEIITMSVKIR